MPIAKVLPNWAVKQQQGFIHDRVLIDNAIEMDTEARIAAMHTSNAALLFLDFAAAFPSIAWAYLWLVLEYAGFPQIVIDSIKGLYTGNRHFLRFMGSIFWLTVLIQVSSKVVP